MRHWLAVLVLSAPLLATRHADATSFVAVTARMEYPNCPFGAMKAPNNAPTLCNPQLMQTTQPRRPFYDYNPIAWRNGPTSMENPLFPFCPPNYECRPTAIPENGFMPFFICCLEASKDDYLQCPFPEVKVPLNPMIFGQQKPIICGTNELDLSWLRSTPFWAGLRHTLRIYIACPFGSVCRPALNGLFSGMPEFIQAGTTDVAICCRPTFK